MPQISGITYGRDMFLFDDFDPLFKVNLLYLLFRPIKITCWFGEISP